MVKGYLSDQASGISSVPIADRSEPGSLQAEHRLARQLELLCPTNAIRADSDVVRVDRGSCILCGRCVAERGDIFAFDPSIEVAALSRSLLFVPELTDLEHEREHLREQLGKKVYSLRRSIYVRHIDLGSDGAEEWEIAALNNPVYDIARLGIFFTASPRHADILLATGVGASNMVDPALRTFEAMAEPKIVIALGTDAISAGIFQRSDPAANGIASILPIDLWVPGSPPSPLSIRSAIFLAVDLLPKAKVKEKERR